ncbi:MAG: hypothetical protein A2Y40_04010 [Candidatus Margulisbacteria bacterium GWF2_35_9]|nr:MAG: hypothetical protein A2Y40_04010 [Candidatus Margulisbacteria bacterium GWF2_35_9]
MDIYTQIGYQPPIIDNVKPYVAAQIINYNQKEIDKLKPYKDIKRKKDFLEIIKRNNQKGEIDTSA